MRREADDGQHSLLRGFWTRCWGHWQKQSVWTEPACRTRQCHGCGRLDANTKMKTERLHEAHPRGHGDVLVPSGSRPGGTPSSGFRLTRRATSVRRAETTNLFLKLSFRVSFRPTEELQMGHVVPTPLARAAPLSSFTTWHTRHSEEAQTGYLLPNPRVYLDFSSCSVNILFLCQNPVRGRRLHLAVTRP